MWTKIRNTEWTNIQIQSQHNTSLHFPRSRLVRLLLPGRRLLHLTRCWSISTILTQTSIRVDWTTRLSPSVARKFITKPDRGNIPQFLHGVLMARQSSHVLNATLVAARCALFIALSNAILGIYLCLDPVCAGQS